MARPKEWERIARDQHISLQCLLDAALKHTKHLIMHCEDVLCKEHALEIHTEVAEARFMSRELQALIEDNDKSAAEIEKRVFAKYRTKGG